MKNRKSYVFSAIILIFFLTRCDLVDSNESSENELFEIRLSSFNLTENDSITVNLKNNSTELVLIYEKNINSRLKKKNNDGNWERLVRQVVAFSDWYTHLESSEIYTCYISRSYVSGYTENIEGTYRVIFDLVFNEEYNNKESVISDEFEIK